MIWSSLQCAWVVLRVASLLFLPFLFALVVAAYSALLSDLIAAEGRYLSPVAFGPCVDGLPDLVRHFCLVHFFKLLCGGFHLFLEFHNSNKVITFCFSVSISACILANTITKVTKPNAIGQPDTITDQVSSMSRLITSPSFLISFC